MTEELKVVFSANPDEFIAGVRRATQSLKDFDGAQKNSAQKTISDIKEQILQQSRLNALRKQALADLRAQAGKSGGIQVGDTLLKQSDLPSEVTSGGAGISKLIPKWFLWFQAISLVKEGISKVVDGLVGFVKTGIEFDAQLESARIGIGSLIAAQTQQVDVTGKQVDAGTALVNSYKIAEDQIKKLRIAGLQTIATTSQLIDAFQQAVGPGLGAGLNLDQVRQTTVEIVQAATAIGVPLNQLNEEVRSLFTGTIDQNSRLAKTLGITSAMVLQWREQGTLSQNLQARLETFRAAGEETAKTFTGIASNLKEAFMVIAGDAFKPLFTSLRDSLLKGSEGVFDFDTAQVSAKFKPIVDVVADLSKQLGGVLSDSIQGLVQGAQSLAEWFRENDAETKLIVKNVGEVVSQMVGLIADVAKLSIGFDGADAKSGDMADSLGASAIVIAVIRDALIAILNPIDTIKRSFLGLVDVLLILVEAGLNVQKSLSNAIGDKDMAAAAQAAYDYIDKLSSKIESMKDLQAGGATTKLLEDMQKFGDEGAKATDKLKLSAEEAKKQLKELDAQIAELTKKMQDLQRRGLTIEAGNVGKQIADLNAKRQQVALAGGLSLSSLPQPPDPKKSAAALNDLKQSVESQIRLIVAAYNRDKAALDELLADNRISYAQYFNDITARYEKQIDDEIAQKKRLLNSPLLKDAGDREKLKNEIAALGEDLDKFTAEQRKRRAESERQLDQELLGIHAQHLRDQNDLVGAFAAEDAKRYDHEYAQAMANGRLTEADEITKKKAADRARAAVQEYQNIFNQVSNGVNQANQGLDIDVRGGKLFQSQADEQKRANQAAEVQQLQAAIDAAQKSTDGLSGFELTSANQSIEQMKLQLKDLKVSIDQDALALGELKKSGEDALRQGLSQALLDVTDRTKGLGEAFRGVLYNIAQAVRKTAADILANLLTTKIMDAVSSLFGGGPNKDNKSQIATAAAAGAAQAAPLSIAAGELDSAGYTVIYAAYAISSAAKELASAAVAAGVAEAGSSVVMAASGGAIFGAGTDTSDSIAARLSNGEYVLNAAATRAVGYDTLNAINFGRKAPAIRALRGGTPGFAAGGPVLAPGGSQGVHGQIGVTLDRGLILETLQSPEGQRVQLRVASKNSRGYRQAIRS